MRGALGLVLSLSEEEKKRGLVAMSSGNFAVGLAFCRSICPTPMLLVVPESLDAQRMKYLKDQGCEIKHIKGFEEADKFTREMAQKEGRVLAHSGESYNVIAGQATCTKELLQEVPTLDSLVIPVGSSGNICGATAARAGAEKDFE